MHFKSTFFVAALPALVACGSGDWVVTTWGEAFIEENIEAAEFSDGCSAVYDRFEVEFTSATLLYADETLVGDVPVERVELTEPGPHELGTVAVRPGDYDRVYYTIGSSSGDAVRAAGALTCGEQIVTFDWAFDVDARYRCLPLSVAVPGGGEVVTELTVHGDHLFFDSLLDEDVGLQGQAIVEADGNGDGVVTLEELGAVDMDGLDYPTGTYADISSLADFIDALVQGVGHVDGEGHCFVDG